MTSLECNAFLLTLNGRGKNHCRDLMLHSSEVHGGTARCFVGAISFRENSNETYSRTCRTGRPRRRSTFSRNSVGHANRPGSGFRYRGECRAGSPGLRRLRPLLPYRSALLWLRRSGRSLRRRRLASWRLASWPPLVIGGPII